MPLLEIDQLTVHFPGTTDPVVRALSLNLRRGEIGCVLGPSGCGKTTVLRAIAGFIAPSAGLIRLDGQQVAGPDRVVAPERRGVGVVFQDYALFPHLTVAENVAFGLRHWTKIERAKRVAELLVLVGLADVGKRGTQGLSGGQQQRVALARALAPRPRLLLMDEPFSNLDPDLRERLAIEVREILQADGTTALLVTHDQLEAFAMADTIGVMHEGRIEQWDAPWMLYHRPASRVVADFIGLGAFLPGRRVVHGSTAQLEMECGTLPIPDADRSSLERNADAQGRVTVLLRPDDVVHDDASPLQAEVVRKAFRGADFLYTLRLRSGATMLAMVPSHHDHAVGEQIGVRFDADHVITFSPTPARA
ncbi:MAG: ABC transporter ATP-binding protein [Betaproteobacteria bacterium]|jgi:iron(III) transport system ATP-binding protein|nr:ABC transporter ATP-binding protein [Betaproteobacteria bacterium]